LFLLKGPILSLCKTSKPLWPLFIAICVCLMLPGCGNKNPKTIQVQGKITYRGKPLDKAEVQFSPISDKSQALRRIASGEVDANGVYSLSTFTRGDGVLPGDYMVTVTPVKRKSGIDGEEVAPKPSALVPEVYLRTDTTPLKATIPADASGTLERDFEIKD
jgi:hypothetical protein